MERSDLLHINADIFSQQGVAINENAADDIRVFVVGNPCNTNALIAMRAAHDVSQDRFFAMTMLDQNRARMQLALKADVNVHCVTELTIWGNHSGTQYPDFYNAKINGQPVPSVIDDIDWLQHDFIEIVQKRGAAIIKARQASSAASAANAVLSGVYHLVHDTPPGDTFSMGLASRGQYGVDPGLIYSYPCRVVNGQLEVVEGIVHNDFGKAKLEATLAELKSEREGGSLGT